MTHQELDGIRTAAALKGEAGRRGLELPRRLTAPNDEWHGNYPKIAAETILPSSLHVLEAALETVTGCVEPLLDDVVVKGTWDPNRLRWITSD